MSVFSRSSVGGTLFLFWHHESINKKAITHFRNNRFHNQPVGKSHFSIIPYGITMSKISCLLAITDDSICICGNNAQNKRSFNLSLSLILSLLPINYLFFAYICAIARLQNSPFDCKITQKFRYIQIYFVYFYQKSDFHQLFHKIHHIRQFFHICMAQIKGPFCLYQQLGINP